MEETLRGPLEIEGEARKTIGIVINNFAGAGRLTLVWDPDVSMWEMLEFCDDELKFIRAVNVAVFCRNSDELLFFTPTVYHKDNCFYSVPPNEKSFLFPLKAFYKLSPDEQVRTTRALLEAAWKEAKQMDEGDVVELLEEG